MEKSFSPVKGIKFTGTALGLMKRFNTTALTVGTSVDTKKNHKAANTRRAKALGATAVMKASGEDTREDPKEESDGKV